MSGVFLILLIWRFFLVYATIRLILEELFFQKGPLYYGSTH
jgi:hypothetical protein